MDRRRSIVIGLAMVVALAVAACGGAAEPGSSTLPTASPSVAGGGGGGTSGGGGGSTEPGGSVPGSEGPGPVEPTPDQAASGVIRLHGRFVGRTVGPLASADQTVDFELDWYAGPDDIHDMRAFRFVSGAFTFSESIEGVCGGSRSEAGDLSLLDDTALAADLTSPDQLQVALIDTRLENNAVSFSAFSGLYVSEPDPAGCGNSSSFGVAVCALEFAWLGVGQLESEARCEDESLGTVWSGTLSPVG